MLPSVIRRQQFLISRASCFLLQTSHHSLPFHKNDHSLQNYASLHCFQHSLYNQQKCLVNEMRYYATPEALLLRRSFTSSTGDLPPNNNKNDENSVKQTKPKKLGYFQKFRYMVDVFWTGCKALFQDVRLAFKTRRKLGLYHVQDFSRLTREELRHMRQVNIT